MTTRTDIEIYRGREPDLRAADANVVIDVLRAFTTAHVALEGGATDIALAGSVEEAFELSERRPDRLLAGERDARRVEGFDAGNSPAVVSRLDVSDRGMILTTTNGVRATLNALSADLVLVTGWSNAPATIDRLRRVFRGATGRLNLVASHPVSDEDLACAEFIAGELLGTGTPEPRAVRRRIRSARSAQKFYSREFRLRDLDLACRAQTPSYAMRVDAAGPVPTIRRGSIS